MKASHISLLYQISTSIVKDNQMKESLVNLVKFIASNYVEAMRCFYVLKEYQHFDPHVGDTACQVRALQVSMLAQKPNYGFDRNEVERNKAILEQAINVLAQGSVKTVKNNFITIEDFLIQFNLSLEISKENMLLVVSYILTKYKKENGFGDHYIDVNKIKQDANISVKSCKKLIRHYQLTMARQSCIDIINYAQKFGFSSEYTRHLEQLIKNDDDGRNVMPCFLQMEVIIEVLQQMQLKVVLEID